MNDSTASSTSVQDRPWVDDTPETTVATASPGPRARLRQRVRTAPTGAKVAVGSAALVVALLAAGLGGFGIGRATEGDGTTPTSFDPQGRGPQQGGGQDPFGQGGPAGQGLRDGQGLPDAGTAPDGTTDGTDGTDGTGSTEGDTQSNWYVVPTPAVRAA